MKTPPHGMTTIAAIPRTGGAGMEARGETNTRPIRYDPWRVFSNHANISDRAGWHIQCILWMEIEREREACESWLRGPGRQVNI